MKGTFSEMFYQSLFRTQQNIFLVLELPYIVTATSYSYSYSYSPFVGVERT